MKLQEWDFELTMLLLGGVFLVLGTFSTLILAINGNQFWLLSGIFSVIGYFLIKIDWKENNTNCEGGDE